MANLQCNRCWIYYTYMLYVMSLCNCPSDNNIADAHNTCDSLQIINSKHSLHIALKPWFHLYAKWLKIKLDLNSIGISICIICELYLKFSGIYRFYLGICGPVKVIHTCMCIKTHRIMSLSFHTKFGQFRSTFSVCQYIYVDYRMRSNVQNFWLKHRVKKKFFGIFPIIFCLKWPWCTCCCYFCSIFELLIFGRVLKLECVQPDVRRSNPMVIEFWRWQIVSKYIVYV